MIPLARLLARCATWTCLRSKSANLKNPSARARNGMPSLGALIPKLAGYVNDVRKQLYGKLNDMVDQAAPTTKSGPGVRALNARYSNIIEAERLLRERLAHEEGNEPRTAAFAFAWRVLDWNYKPAYWHGSDAFRCWRRSWPRSHNCRGGILANSALRSTAGPDSACEKRRGSGRGPAICGQSRNSQHTCNGRNSKPGASGQRKIRATGSRSRPATGKNSSFIPRI